MLGPLGPSLASQVRASRTIYAWVKPIAKWYINVSGYRKMGLTYDDLRALFAALTYMQPSDSQSMGIPVVEENEAVQRVRIHFSIDCLDTEHVVRRLSSA
jgi:hypothetical protein